MTKNYLDPARTAYETFLKVAMTQGLQWGLMLRPQFFGRGEKFQSLPFPILLPLQTHSRIMLMVDEAKLNEAKQKLKQMPEFADRPIPEHPTLRDYISSFFFLYPDDEIELNVKKGSHIVWSREGKIGDIKVSLEEITNPENKLRANDLLTIQLKIVNKGQQRLNEESRSLILDTSLFAEKLMNKRALQLQLAGLSDERLVERLELFNQTVPEGHSPQRYALKINSTDFGLDNLIAIEEVIAQLNNEYLTNSQVMEAKDSSKIMELEKMKNWVEENQI